MTDKLYPGDTSSPYELNLLADCYRDAAQRAYGTIQLGLPITAAPMRMLAIHSIELNLSAFLLAQGQNYRRIRALGHSVAARLDLALGYDLELRERTVEHIRIIERDREYLIARYGADCLSDLSQVDLLLATCIEVAKTVSSRINAMDWRLMMKVRDVERF